MEKIFDKPLSDIISEEDKTFTNILNYTIDEFTKLIKTKKEHETQIISYLLMFGVDCLISGHKTMIMNGHVSNNKELSDAIIIEMLERIIKRTDICASIVRMR